MLVSDYTGWVTSNHRTRPKYMAFLKVLLSLWADYAACVKAIEKSFDRDTATGANLDLIGQIVGAGRYLPFEPSEASRTLSDGDYRKLIAATIARNTWDGTHKTLPAILSAAFPQMGITIRDNLDMTLSAVVRGTFTQLQIEMLNADLLIPRPAGVGMTYEVPKAISETTVHVQGGLFTAQEPY